MTTRSRSWKVTFTAFCFLFTAASASAQMKAVYPEDQLSQEEMAAHLRFIASDKLLGRMTGTPGNDEAARYIAGEFKKSGLAAFQSAEGYFQRVPLLRKMPPGKGTIVLLGDSLNQPNKMALRSGGPLKWSGRFEYVGYGLVDTAKGIDDYKGIDIKGKIALARFGQKGESNLFAALMSAAETKRRAAQARGAVALVELYQGPREWKSIVTFFMRTGVETGSVGGGFPHFIVEDISMAYVSKVQARSSGEIALQTDGIRQEEIRAQNVIGFLRGSDPKLRDEFVLLTAHYDHVGVGKPEGSPADSIYNGARDNGMGTVALIAAAKSFSKDPPKRSVIIAAVTGEEMGLLGSSHLAAEPPVPMAKIVFNLNIDGAGYDDTTIVTVVGLERTNAESALKQGTERYGLKVMAEPVELKGLFDRSDNVSFAARGVPAPTFSEGFHSFGPEILKYYHRAADQADENFNFSYLLKFCKAFVHSARIIGDMPVAPFWKAGDPYEQAGKKLYQRN
jgi:hypothetical protein